MFIENKIKSTTICSEHVKIEVLKSGDIRTIFVDDVMINQLVGNYLDGMTSNLFLRVKGNDVYEIIPLLGQSSKSVFAIVDNQVVYRGQTSQIDYLVYVTPKGYSWFYDVKLTNKGRCSLEVDIIYGQDIGLASMGHVKGNEAYDSQYIDHKVFNTSQGYVVCSRQNQEQNNCFPFLQQGSFTKIVAFSTDGYPFFGTKYKFTNTIQELQSGKLNNRVYQYEFAYAALQSESILLSKTANITFYGSFQPTIETQIETPLDVALLKQLHEEIKYPKPEIWQQFTPNINVHQTVTSLPLSQEELNTLYPIQRHQERKDGKLLSFFKDTYEHVVLMEKELYVERSHGHIILTGENDFAQEGILASTNYMYGVFNSQVVVGNTTFNKLLSNCRNGLNISKVSGQRVMIKINDKYQLLTMPAVYEMGFNYAKWIYKLEDDIIEVISYTMLDQPRLKMEITSKKNHVYDFIVYQQVCTGANEYESSITVEQQGQSLIFKPDKDTLAAKTYPDLTFVMHFDEPYALHDDSIFYEELGSMNEPVVALTFHVTSKITMALEGRIDGQPIIVSSKTFAEEAEEYRTWLHQGIHQFKLSIDNEAVQSEVERFNDVSLWYSHNARVHYSSPHGLEQYGGAAWGSRDVCQGPFEYFMATQNYPVAKDILIKIFEHQYIEDGSWPQWFMFDKYYRNQHHESHGDIIVWPFKSISQYLLTTNDLAFLDQEVCYTKKQGYEPTAKKETVYQHIKKIVHYLQEHFIEGTSLSCYGDGDWDDTLQPANSKLRERMVSGWTVTLTYQVVREFSFAIEKYDAEYANTLKELAKQIQADYRKYVIKDGVTAGFLHFENDHIDYLLHPRDQKTGLKYRLLPMTRSMISEMFTKEEAKHHYQLLKEYLYHPDGVRLMDTTCTYRGGVTTYFKRAETAANFGREVGLQYVHAHIRFVEAMAKMGYTDETWSGLLKINPILINTVVKNALPRQSNCYFSSSDGAFDNRYVAMENYDALRTGDVGVKAGWRIYSSGSGIYINQLIEQVLGIKIRQGKFVIDPVLPKKLDGLVLTYAIAGKPVKIRYHIQEGHGVTQVKIDCKKISFTPFMQAYRTPSAAIDVSLIKKNSIIDVYI